ncbi:hypothetical protein Taro_045431 [Colocasia esculenta]|uniref:Uncharacterized protein n=1 Tax=Colocasia esculenta TaxID=4460 RepID=A0A843WPF3_COLES|nr:hypothetical protein [Colocasia esculenta]
MSQMTSAGFRFVCLHFQNAARRRVVGSSSSRRRRVTLHRPSRYSLFPRRSPLPSPPYIFGQPRSMGISTFRQHPSSLTTLMWLIWDRMPISLANSLLCRSSTILDLLMATTSSFSSSVLLYAMAAPSDDPSVVKKLLTLSRDDHEDSVSRMKATEEALKEKQKNTMNI